jgi:hypothetical protein
LLKLSERRVSAGCSLTKSKSPVNLVFSVKYSGGKLNGL